MAMLKREEMPVAAVTGGSDLNALLGRGSEFDGKFTGTIVSNDVLVVGEGAKIAAEITCGTIIVHGEINGNIKARNLVELHHPAKVRGNIETPVLMIEKGVMFEGQTKMEGVEKPAQRPVATPVPIK